MRFFFYGTLIDEDVRSAVLQEFAGSGRIKPARLPGWRRFLVRGRSYPVVVPRRRSGTDGILVDGLPAEALARLVLYEGPEYDLREYSIETPEGTKTAYVFVAGQPCRLSSVSWSFTDWQRPHKRTFIAGFRLGRLR